MVFTNKPSNLIGIFCLTAVVTLLTVVALAQDPNRELRGAPIGAKPPEASLSDPGQIRVIPQESWDLLDSMEGDGDELFDFKPSHDGIHLKVPFGALSSYIYEVPDPARLRTVKEPETLLGDQIPSRIKMLDEQKVLLVGFMVPIDVDRRGNVTAFALTQNQSFCCYGIPPGLTELVIIEMEEGKTAPYAYDIPIATYGSLHIGEEIDDGYILSLYRMTGTEVVDVRELMRRAKKSHEKTDD